MLAGLTKGALEMLEQALHTCNQAARIKIGGTKVK
jgi:hypothetical protein